MSYEKVSGKYSLHQVLVSVSFRAAVNEHSLVTRNLTMCARLGSAFEGVVSHDDRLNPRYTVGRFSLRNPFFSELPPCRAVKAVLQIQHVGFPLMMKARQIDGILRVHVEIEHVEDHFHHSGRDARSAGSANNHEELAVFGDDGRSHRRERPLAWLNRVCLSAHQAEHIRFARFRDEIVHFVVQQEAQDRVP